jgi:hypothetical protein
MKKMKKRSLNQIVTLFIIVLLTNNIYGQSKYLNINAGYGFKMSSGNVVDFYNSAGSINSYTAKQINLSLGKGINFGGAFGYMFNKNIGTELGFNYMLGDKSNASPNSYFSNFDKIDYNLYARMLRINPSIVIASGLNVINPYAKIGLIIGSGSVFKEEILNQGSNITINKIKMNGSLAIGGNAGLGVLCKLSKKMSCFGEINMVNLSYAPTKGKIEVATYNGIDVLSTKTTSEKEIEYVDSYTYFDSNPPALSEPSKGLKSKMPFGSVGITLGMRICYNHD